jgi:threonine dehydrogenase-like Zn-dependent dehydrogenase
MEWIDINKIKPQINKRVLLLTDQGAIEGWIPDHDYCDYEFIVLDTHGCGCCGSDTDVVTHWQPLPNPPTNHP